MDRRQGILSRPLRTDTLDEASSLLVRHDGFEHSRIAAFERSKEYIDAAFLHLRTQVVQEAGKRLRRPGAAREILRRVELVLRHHHADTDSFGLISVDEAPEVASVRCEVARVLNEHILAFVPHLVRADAVVLLPRIGLRLGVKVIALHPAWWTPWRSPQSQLLLVPQRRLNKRNQRPTVVVDDEMLQVEIAVGLVVAVGLRRKIVGADRHPAIRETRSRCGIEELPQHALAIRLPERLKRRPAEFVEAGAESVDSCPGRKRFLRLDIEVEHLKTERGF